MNNCSLSVRAKSQVDIIAVVRLSAVVKTTLLKDSSIKSEIKDAPMNETVATDKQG